MGEIEVSTWPNISDFFHIKTSFLVPTVIFQLSI